MEPDSISSQKAECSTRTPCQPLRVQLSYDGVEVRRSCAEIWGHGDPIAALCLAPWVTCLGCDGQRRDVIIALVPRVLLVTS